MTRSYATLDGSGNVPLAQLGNADAAGAAAAAQAASQPLDSDLTAIAALSTTSFGRALLALADAAALRTAGGLGSLATQSGTFSGTSSGTNTGDQTSVSGNAGTVTTNANLTGLITSVGNATNPQGLFLPYRTGGTFYYATQSGVIAALALVQNTEYAVPFLVPVTTTFDSIGVVASGATASAACRLGIYNDASGVPGTLVLDAGSVATATSGFKTIVISQSLTAGWYWLACAMQGAAGALFCTPISGVTWVGTTAPGFATNTGYSQTGISGALPSPWGATKTEMTKGPVVYLAPH